MILYTLGNLFFDKDFLFRLKQANSIRRKVHGKVQEDAAMGTPGTWRKNRSGENHCRDEFHTDLYIIVCDIIGPHTKFIKATIMIILKAMMLFGINV